MEKKQVKIKNIVPFYLVQIASDSTYIFRITTALKYRRINNNENDELSYKPVTFFYVVII